MHTTQPALAAFDAAVTEVGVTAPNYGFDGLMAVAAFRYCLGRRTYIVGACVDWLIDQWQAFPPNVRRVIARDLREAFERDDAARQHGDHYPLGMDCYRRDWQRAMDFICAREAVNVGGEPEPTARANL